MTADAQRQSAQASALTMTVRPPSQLFILPPRSQNARTLDEVRER